MAYRYSSTKITQDWVAIIRQDPCSYCGRTTHPITIDHIIPFCKRGEVKGLKNWANLAPACEKCNIDRGNMGVLLFLVQNQVRLTMRGGLRS